MSMPRPGMMTGMVLLLAMTLAAGCNNGQQEPIAPEDAATNGATGAAATAPDAEPPAQADADADDADTAPDVEANGYAALHPDAEAAPAFTLPNSHGESVSLADFRGQWVLLEWINHDCPFVVKFYQPGRMQQWQREYTDEDVAWLSIASSAPGKQGHESPERWNELTEEKEAAPTHVLIDEDGEVGRAYNARTTPQIVVIDPEGRMVYNGGIDNMRSRRSDDIDRAENYIVKVLDAVLAGEPAPVRSSEPYGCAVHY